MVILAIVILDMEVYFVKQVRKVKIFIKVFQRLRCSFSGGIRYVFAGKIPGTRCTGQETIKLQKMTDFCRFLLIIFYFIIMIIFGSSNEQGGMGRLPHTLVPSVWTQIFKWKCKCMRVQDFYCQLYTTIEILRVHTLPLPLENLELQTVLIADVAVMKRHQRLDEINIIFTRTSSKIKVV